jgi:hypothetical protein
LSFPLVSAPAAENQFVALSVTLPQIEKDILKYHRLLALSPRSDPHRPTLLMLLAVRRNSRYPFSLQKDDFDKSIVHLTEAVLLPFQPSEDVVLCFFHLATALLTRFIDHEQLEDLKSSLKYFRFLHINVSPLEAFGTMHGLITTRLVRALACNLRFGSDDMIQGMEEMAALITEFLASDVSRYHDSESRQTIQNFSMALTEAVTRTEILHREDTQQVVDRVIQMVREATVLKPDLHVSLALASCLDARFMTTHVINDFEEAIAIADNIVAAPSPGKSLTPMQTDAIWLISSLEVSRLNSYSRPEYLEESTHRIRTILRLPSLPDKVRTGLAAALDSFAELRFRYFGVARAGDSGETPPTPPDISNLDFAVKSPARRQSGVGPEDGLETQEHLKDILTTIQNDETTDVEASVEFSRKILPLHRSSSPWTKSHAMMFADILFAAHRRTNRLDYLNEAITAYRDLRKVSAAGWVHFHAGHYLLLSVVTRWRLSNLRHDLEEAMQLFPELVNDRSAEAFFRFRLSYDWAYSARNHAHTSISTAYETAMSLMHETLNFSPTLQTQHFHIARASVGQSLTGNRKSGHPCID